MNAWQKEWPIKGFDFSRAGDGAMQLKDVMRRLGLPGDVIRRASVGAYEAELNVIIHARRGVMRASVTAEETKVVVEDEGPGIADVNQAMCEGFSTAPPEIREMGFGAGMGLPNMKRCADELVIDSKPGVGTSVSMLFRHQRGADHE